MSKRDATAGVAQSVTTQLGPILALTSWTSVLSVLEHEAVDDPGARCDLVQLRGLCDAADNEAFAPVSSEELSDQRTPAFVIQLSSIVQAAVEQAVTENVLSVTGTRPQADSERIGRYVRVAGDQVAGGWIGIHFGLWKSHGTTPLWLLFSDTEFGRAQEVRPLVEPWAAQNGILTASSDHTIAIALDIPVGEEREGVIRSLVDDIKAIAAVLGALPPKTLPSAEEE